MISKTSALCKNWHDFSLLYSWYLGQEILELIAYSICDGINGTSRSMKSLTWAFTVFIVIILLNVLMNTYTAHAVTCLKYKAKILYFLFCQNDKFFILLFCQNDLSIND